MVEPHPTLTSAEVDAYLARLGVERGEVTVDVDGLRRIHLAHLERIPFENLDIVFGGGVQHDRSVAIDKILDDGDHRNDVHRGGWCFELNGSLALLLGSLGFDVRLLGAAVLLGGPSQVIDHLLLEVSSSHLAPQLVDVGFGDSFDLPLALNTSGPQTAGSGVFELMGSPQGTTLTRHVDGVPTALLRFKRVAHSFDDFAPVARSLQADPTKHWASKPFATRRLTDTEVGFELVDGADAGAVQIERRRVTLTHDRIKIERNGTIDEQQLGRSEWDGALTEWFATARPGPWPDDG